MTKKYVQFKFREDGIAPMPDHTNYSQKRLFEYDSQRKLESFLE